MFKIRKTKNEQRITKVRGLKKALLLAFFAGFGLNGANAQSEGGNKWTLQQCIDYAVQNNLQIKLANLNAEVSKLASKDARNNLLPDLNGSMGQNFLYGRSIDPFTNTFVNQTVRSNSFGLNSSVTLFSGLQLQNSIKRAKLDEQASQSDAEKAKNDMILNIITAYMQILFSDELLTTSNLVLNNTLEQASRTEKLFKAGSVAQNAVLEINAQIASDELSVINAQNQKDIAELNLLQLLDLQTKDNFEIVKPDLPDPDQTTVNFNAGTVFETAQRTMPEIKAADLRVQSAIRGVAVSRGAYYPRLSLSGNISSGYSNTRVIPVGATTVNTTIGVIDVNGTPTPITTTVQQPIYGTYAFGDQFNDNLSKSISLNLTVPIFNGFQTRNNVSRSKIGVQQAELNSKVARNQLRQTIQQAYADALASRNKFIAAKKQLDAFEQTFKNAQLRFNSGVLNSTDFNVAKNNYNKAQSDIIQAKYDYTFKLKILDFYQGKPISF